MMLDTDDGNLVVFLAAGGGCSLNSSPGKNWVEKSGGLPGYICKIAKAVMRGGKSKSSAIAIAVSRVKKWAAGGDDVDADTKAKAAKALAAWEALKAKNKARQVVAASHPREGQYIMLTSQTAFNTDLVRRAWEAIELEARQQKRAENRAAGKDSEALYDEVPYSWIKELWTDHIVVEVESRGGPAKFMYVPYTVSGKDVSFGDPQEVVNDWRPVLDDDEEEDDVLTEYEAALLGDLLQLSQKSPLEELLSRYRG